MRSAGRCIASILSVCPLVIGLYELLSTQANIPAKCRKKRSGSVIQCGKGVDCRLCSSRPISACVAPGYVMQRPLLSADIRDLHQALEAMNIHEFYGYLKQRGYGFAAWAGEAARGEQDHAVSPADFLRSSPLPGICSPIFQILGKTQVDKMRVDLARAYFRALQRIARSNNESIIERDVNAIEVSVLYREALERNGLSIENWNLYFPFTILKRLGGEDAVEVYWEFLRDTPMRSPHIGIVANLATVAFMYKQTMSTDTKVRQMASSWLSRNPAMDSQDTIETRFNWGLDAARFSDYQGLASFLEALDLEGHGIPHDREASARSSSASHSSKPSDTDSSHAPMEDWETELELNHIYRALMARLTGGR